MLLDEVRVRIRRLNYSIRPEDAWVDWVRWFVLIHVRRHPRDMGATETKAFLTHLAVASKESASIRNPAIERTAIFYRQVFGIDEPWLTDAASARQGKRLPGLLTMVR